MWSWGSCLMGGLDSEGVSSAASASSFRLLPLGAGSRGVRQYVTVLVTTCRTLTRPGLPFVSGSTWVGEKVALHGAALSGVEVYGEEIDWAEPMAGENGDCGIWRRRGVRADLGAGLAKVEAGIAMRGDSGRVLVAVLALLEKDAAL